MGGWGQAVIADRVRWRSGSGVRSLAVLSVAVAFLAGCGASGDSGVASAGTVSEGAARPADMPSIYLEQTRWLVDHGRAVEETAYRQHLATCMQNTPARTVPLDPGEAVRLGRVHVQSWRQAGRFAVREESWGWTVGPEPCRFQVIHKQAERIGDGTRYEYDIDLATRRGEKTDGGGPMDVQPALEPTEESIATVTGSMLETRQQSVGQPCLAWKDSDGYRACLWTGGEKWGFGSLGPARGNDADGSYPGQIALSATPPDGGSGWQVTTSRMSVGGRVDPGVFEVPQGVALQDTGG